MIKEQDFYDAAERILSFDIKQTDGGWYVKLFDYVVLWNKSLSYNELIEQVDLLFTGMIAAFVAEYKKKVKESREEFDNTQLH